MNQIKRDCEVIPWHSLDVRRELKNPTEGQKQLDKKDQCGAEAPPKTPWYILILDEVDRIVDISSKQIKFKAINLAVVFLLLKTEHELDF